MAKRASSGDEETKSRRRPATTPEAREDQLIALATDLAEEQMLAGTASAQVISYYLKLGSSREKLEQERLAHENELLQARTAAIEQGANMEILAQKAIVAITTYRSSEPPDSDEAIDG